MKFHSGTVQCTWAFVTLPAFTHHSSARHHPPTCTNRQHHHNQVSPNPAHLTSCRPGSVWRCLTTVTCPAPHPINPPRTTHAHRTTFSGHPIGRHDPEHGLVGAQCSLAPFTPTAQRSAGRCPMACPEHARAPTPATQRSQPTGAHLQAIGQRPALRK